jgi:hypothetical protein
MVLQQLHFLVSLVHGGTHQRTLARLLTPTFMRECTIAMLKDIRSGTYQRILEVGIRPRGK